MPRKPLPDLAKAEFLQAYIDNNCRAVFTCRQLGVAVDTVQDWQKTDEEFAKAMIEARSLLNEQVEGGLVEQALKPDGPPVSKIFYLKNNWKEKYGENQQVEVIPSELWFNRPTAINGEIVTKELPDQKLLEDENATT